MKSLAPEYTQPQAEISNDPEAQLSLFDLWYTEDAECLISGPVIERARTRVMEEIINGRFAEYTHPSDIIGDIVSLTFDEVMHALGITPEQAEGLQKSTFQIKRKLH